MPDQSTLPANSRFGLFLPLANRNFRFLWFGSVLSYVGAQLTLIAFPWLVLRLTNDPLAMGAVLAVAGIPRAIFMVFGGALTDRFSALTVMIWTNWFRLILMLGLAYLVYSGLIEMWMVYGTAFIFGIADAFYWPASLAIMPKVLPAKLLPAGNSLQQGLAQISLMLGPLLAGILIVAFTGEGEVSTTAGLLGISIVFLIDGIGFIVSLLALLMIHLTPASEGDKDQFNIVVMLESILEGFVATWRDLPLRIISILFAVFSLFFRGPYLVGIPVMCDIRFDQGALAYGMITSAFGVGALIGLVIAGSTRKPPDKYLGLVLLFDFLVLGIGFICYAFTPHVELAMFFSALGGITDGYLVVILISWLQVRIPEDLLGRVMSVIMLFNVGLTPITASVAGALIRWSLDGVFLIAGCTLIGLSIMGFAIPVIRRLGIESETIRLTKMERSIDIRI
jgi:MFS family permease